MIGVLHGRLSIALATCSYGTQQRELARRKFVSITLNNKRTALAVTVERRKERKQFCAFSARARFHIAWTLSGHSTSSAIELTAK
jgi:hypothetical protein